MENKKEVTIVRTLSAPRELVFKAWTDPRMLANWWGPNGFTAPVCEADARPGGKIRICMHAPQLGFPNHWMRGEFKEVVPPERLVFISTAFEDENGNAPLEILNTITFEDEGGKTKLTVHAHVLRATPEMAPALAGMDMGWSQSLDKLEVYTQAQHTIRKELKTTKTARTSTYLNFPGNTEEAFNFYRSVFGTEYHGNGIQRFGDIPPVEGAPPLSAEDKKLILHVELPILGGHVLMATDAPESMGFKVNPGNNIHINLEPDSRDETKRLFDALADGGNITMPLKDMFWGGYYGSCTDRFGINWMVNYSE